jgi:hypothetical protein
MQVACVDPILVPQIWPRAAFLIREAMRRGGISSFVPVERSVLQGRALLWLAVEGKDFHAAAVTELIATEWRRLCIIVACGGSFEARAPSAREHLRTS